MIKTKRPTVKKDAALRAELEALQLLWVDAGKTELSASLKFPTALVPWRVAAHDARTDVYFACAAKIESLLKDDVA
jgi:hypothetical protein